MFPFSKILAMKKFTTFAIGALLAAAILVFIQHLFNLGPIPGDRGSVREQHDELSDFVRENARVSNLGAQTASPTPPSNDASRDLLRLRGEAGQLRRENEEAR